MPVPVITISRMREWEEATWAAGRTEAEVIGRVGRAVAECARRLSRPGDTVLILAGKGHNGDDARAARPHLGDRAVALLNVADPKAALARLDTALARKPALVIDALFGIGLRRPLDAAWIQFITRVNQARRQVLAVDVPSGLNADTGETWGAAVKATVTLTVGAPKTGLLQRAAWPVAGRIEVAANVGLAPCPPCGELDWVAPADFTGFPPSRTVAGHKGDFGHLAIIAGSVGYHGAAVLAARGAQRAQPGLITLFTHKPAYPAAASQLQAVMVRPWSVATFRRGEFSATLIGPGLAGSGLPGTMKTTARRLWQDSRTPVIVDASALDWLQPGPAPKDAIRVLTPHPGEAARLLNTTTRRVQSDRPRALREISRRFGDCWVALKGHQTLIGRSRGGISVNSSGNPHLAQGGSGDVLAGFIAGMLTQPVLQKDAGRALGYAVWRHGAAADALQATRPNWIVEDLLAELGNEPPSRAR